MQNQQQVNYDLLAVFPDESKASGAADKLKKAGFQDDEIHQLAGGTVGSGVYREHGPNTARREFFLQTQRTGPRPASIILFAIVFGVILAVLGFVIALFVHTLSGLTAAIIGAVAGIIIGAIVGALQRGRVRGAIGQAPERAPEPTGAAGTNGARTVVALSFSNPDNISRNSRARAILLNNEGKIDRSIGRQR